jgi:hypothetical protein
MIHDRLDVHSILAVKHTNLAIARAFLKFVCKLLIFFVDQESYIFLAPMTLLALERRPFMKAVKEEFMFQVSPAFCLRVKYF